ncbi:AAA domain-containing protein [Larsenimonas suaedae]|uniref:AAA domain-containing protein n=1 Tax=Larsenimonas suaedae TaxID=1851019 RepID=A0ABU1GVW4_9GAMM|nr:AAA domain-containing protein [Larsenimonas suaedae]MCM2973293.1 AAA domain-containing protein [Larsenimonas suaedae]MDR5896186.1 AAA domain-containing protein [Larsenimonas suaedae]
MSQAASSASQAERILSFWHKVEFFESTELKGIDHGQGAIHYRSDELVDAPNSLPWLDRQTIRRAGAQYRVGNAYRFKLYLGLFRRQEIFEVARKAYPEQSEAWMERSRDEGLTCSLTAMVKEDGTLDRQSIEISTAPWVLGALQQGTLDAVTLDAFEAATEVFRERLTTILTVADNLKSEHGLPPVLSTFEIIEMLKAMQGWTAFAPQSEAPALVVQLLPGHSGNAEHPGDMVSIGSETWTPLAQLSARLDAPEDGAAETTAGDSAAELSTAINEIAILNSFFIRDLETILCQLKDRPLAPGSPLARYLSGEVPRHPDLLLPEGRALLMEQLSPRRMPAGRWPGEDAHSMSLMQQFAINTIDQELEDGGLYSVNGPPGTGKTTMLRDLVARNITKRAEVLAALGSPGAAFGENLTVKLDDQLKPIKTLIPELAGFEMVVASSNNAAVENVTQELPQTKALGDAYQALSYLKPVGQKLAASHEPRGSKLYVEALAPDKACWGLIATALGNKSNRTTFGERIFFKPIDQCEAEGEAEHYRTLVPALKALAEKGGALEDFRAAQRAFNEAKKRVEAAHQDIARLQALKQLVRQTEEGRRRAEIDRRLASRVALWRGKRQAVKVALWPITAYCRHRAQLKQLAQRERRAAQQAEVSEQRLASLEKRLNAEREACHTLETRYQDVLLPDEMLDLDAAEVQRTSFGHCKALNEARGQLTARAFELHQAWLVAAYADKKNQLWATISSLMALLNGSIDDREAAKALWQMLFLIVPVVSSTFASIANQFRALGEGEIGWLFVDEAGQAPPQQAAGALWRAKRAVVVGDPLQIEPVFTVPAGLVEAMAKGEFERDWYKWSPTVSSVQVVADRANPYGTNEISDELWVGSPLRVHRRCDEPMFSIANRIAYNDKMLHGNDDLVPGPGDSRWFDVEGEVSGKHFVPAQAAKVAGMLKRHIDKTGELPSVYVISPFKAVAQGLQTELANRLDATAFGGASALRDWLKARVGTVHTFQGKEEDSVILVLGLSSESPGAANWASAKPNLLNVALTRAKKRVYVVGSTEIWGSKQYFSEASEKLPS